MISGHPETAEAVVQRYRNAKQSRAAWEEHWQQCYDYALPQRGLGFSPTTPGQKRTEKLFDATAPDGVDQLAAGLLSQLTPPWSRWFGLRTGPAVDEAQRAPLAAALEAAAQVAQSHFDRSNFAVEVHQCFLDLVTCGTASLMFEEAAPGAPSAFRFQAVPLAQVIVEEGVDGRLDTTYRRTDWTVARFRHRFPNAELPPDIRSDADKNPDRTIPVIESVVPVGQGYRYMAVLDADGAGASASKVLDSGLFRSNPFINFRWQKAPGEVYGRSPVMKALPDIKTANKVVELVLKNASIAVTGIWQADDDGVLNTTDTAMKREDLRERLNESDFVLVPGGLRLFSGTPHHSDSIYRATPLADTPETPPFLDGFLRLELPVFDDDGNSRWPERFSAERIERLRRSSGPRKFESQMMLRPVDVSEGRLDPARLRQYEGELIDREANGERILLLNGRRLVSASCWWDPAFGAPDAGDASVVACVFTDDHGAYWLHDVAYLTHAPERTAELDEATQMCRQVAHFAKRNVVPSVTLETNGLGRFLPGLLRREIERAGIRCAVLESVSQRAKDLRILDAFDAVMAAGCLNAHTRIWETPFIAEMREWRPGARARDDGLDAVSGCLLSEPVRLARRRAGTPNPDRVRSAWKRGGAAFAAKTEFSV